MSDSQKFRTMDWLIGLSTLLAVGLTTWNFVTTNDNDKRITVIEATRFTSDDAEKMIQPKLDLILQKVTANGEKIERLQQEAKQ